MVQNKLEPAPRGRPPIPKDKVRRNRIVTFLTDKELEKLQALAEQKDTTLSGACYQLVKQKLT